MSSRVLMPNIGGKVRTKCFSPKVEKIVEEVLPPEYDIESYCNTICKVVSIVDNDVVMLQCSTKTGYTTQFRWPTLALSPAFGVR